MLSVVAHTAATVLMSAAPAPFADIFVDTNDANCAVGTGGPGDPVCSIASAIAMAMPGDTIRIAPGTYFENVVVAFDLELVGTGGATVTMIDGGGAGSVVTIPATVNVTIDGLTLTNGANGTGGGIFLENASSLMLSNSTITGNTTTGYYGGAVATYGDGSTTTVTISNSTISNNTGTYGYGGGVSHENGTLLIQSSTISNNYQYYDGAAVYIDGGSLEITNSTISENIAGESGGAIYARNSAGVTLTGSTFDGNTSSIRGGAIHIREDGTPTPLLVTNCTFSGNSTGNGGGGAIYMEGGTSNDLLSSITMTENSAGMGAGGIETTGLTLATLDVRNSIIAGNTSGGAPLDVTGGLLTSLGHNLIGTGSAGFVNGINGDQVGTPGSPLDALLAPLADNGGPTETHFLLAGSTAIDGGDIGNFESVDQRGFPRPTGLGPDIGAVEIGSSIGICSGDGGDQMGCTDCPCGNNAPQGTLGGCLNSAGTSSTLLQSGTASIASADLRFEASGVTPLNSCVLTSGNALAPANPANPCFGLDSGIQSIQLDGLRCVVQGVLRHGVRPSDVNGEVGVTTNGWGDPNGFFNFAAFTSGTTKHFQIIHRDDIAQVCQTGQNTSQASSVPFTP